MENRNYEEKIVLFSCLLGIIGFLPFTIFRFVNKDYLLAFLESSLAIAILVVFFYVWRTHKVKVASVVMCTMYMGVTVAVIHIKGPALLYWIYPTTLGTFCLLNHRTAAVLNLLAALLIFPAIYPKVDPQEVMIIYTSMTLLSLFGYTFTIVTKKQRVQLSQLAEHDALTGALNRRSLDANMLVAISKLARDASRKTSLIILDLDRFKEINDTYGHSSGDQILIRISELIRSNIRMSDRLYRYGGEEFVIILDNTEEKDALTLAENIRHKVEKGNLFDKRGITISLGVAQLKPSACADEWLTSADDALYQAKRTGRNKVCVAGQEDVIPLQDKASPSQDKQSKAREHSSKRRREACRA